MIWMKLKHKHRVWLRLLILLTLTVIATQRGSGHVTFSRTNSPTLNDDEAGLYSGVIDAANECAHFGAGANPGAI
jgi:hypothetical protein